MPTPPPPLPPPPPSTSPPHPAPSATPLSQPPQPIALPPPLPLLPTLLTLLTDLSSTNTTPSNSGIKDLQTNLLPLRLQIKRMRAAIADLPDGERSVEEQKVEIRALEERVRGLRGVVAGLGGRGDIGKGGVGEEGR